MPGERAYLNDKGVGDAHYSHTVSAMAIDEGIGARMLLLFPESISLMEGTDFVVTIKPDGVRAIGVNQDGELTDNRLLITDVKCTQIDVEQVDLLGEDPAYATGRDVTRNDCDYLGDMDTWIRAADYAAKGVPGVTSNNDIIWEMWVKDQRYKNNTHRGNDLDSISGGISFPDGRSARVVVEGLPKLVHSESSQPVIHTEEESFSNDSPHDVTQEFKYLSSKGVSSAINVERSTSISAGASVTIGGFSMNASGTINEATRTDMRNDTTKSTEMSTTRTIDSKSELTQTTITTQQIRSDYYEVTISMRGRNDIGCIYILNDRGGVNNRKSWLKFRSMGAPVGTRTAEQSRFRVDYVTTSTSIKYKQTPLKISA